MKMQREGIEVGRFSKSFIPYDELTAEKNAFVANGRSVQVPSALVSSLQRVLEGPDRASAEQFRAYVRGPWSPLRAAAALLDIATTSGASDLHLESVPSGVEVRLRVVGELTPFVVLDRAEGERLVSALKHLAGCLPYRRDVPQEGRVQRDGVAADVRASFVPTALGERVALRLFGRLMSLSELGLPAATADAFEELLGQPSGLVLVAGPSGGGKTTTLYAALSHVARLRSTAHLSLEDPVEQRLRLAGIAVDQIELSPERGLTAEAALVAALRQDVDVIAVGEIRTPAEASLAVQAAHTGRLVLAGVHAGSAAEASQRLRDLGVEPALLKKTLRGVLHQRLLTTPCPQHQTSACARCGGRGKVRALTCEMRVTA